MVTSDTTVPMPNMSGFSPVSWKDHNASALRRAAEEAAKQTRALGNDVRLVALSEITESSPVQSRLRPFAPDVDDEDRGLVESIRAIGMIEPVVLVQLNSGAGYRIQTGHRRVAAMRYLAYPKIQAKVITEETTGVDSVVLADNVRKDLRPIEWLRAIEGLQGQGHSKEEIVQQTGLTQSHINRICQLENLCAEAREMVEQYPIALKSAIAASNAPLHFQAEILRLVAEQALDERQTEALSRAVIARLTEAGQDAVDVRQVALNLGLVHTTCPDQAGEPKADGARTAGANQAAPAPMNTGKRRPASRAKTLTDKAARDMLPGYLPGLSPAEVTALASETVKRHLSDKVVRLAGMVVAGGRMKPAEAVQIALRFEPLRMAGRWLDVLEAAAAVRGLLDSGGDPALNEPFIACGVQLFGELVKLTAQARKKR